jgi:hypothetical protein
MYNY